MFSQWLPWGILRPDRLLIIKDEVAVIVNTVQTVNGGIISAATPRDTDWRLQIISPSGKMSVNKTDSACICQENKRREYRLPIAHSVPAPPLLICITIKPWNNTPSKRPASVPFSLPWHKAAHKGHHSQAVTSPKISRTLSSIFCRAAEGGGGLFKINRKKDVYLNAASKFQQRGESSQRSKRG